MKLNDTYLQRRETEPAKPRSVQRVVMPPLVIPLEAGQCAVIPLGITADDYECLQKTLALWKKKIVLPEPDDYEI